MNQLTITEFANKFGLSRQAIDQSIKEKRFRFAGYKVEKVGKRTKIVKENQSFLFWNQEWKIYVFVKEDTKELAVIKANEFLFQMKFYGFQFGINDAREIQDNETLISNLTL